MGKLNLVFSALAFAAVATADDIVSANEIPDKAELVSFFQDQQVVSDLVTTARDNVHDRFRDGPPDMGLGFSDDCRTCVWWGAKAVVKWNEKHWEHWCETTKCPKAKAMCKEAERHPGISLGFLIEETRPLSIAFSWCVGAKYCKMEDDIALEEAFDEAEHPLILETIRSTDLGDLFPKDPVDDKRRTDVFEDKVNSQLMKHHLHERHCGPECNCHSCVKAASFVLLNDHFGAALEICDEKHECPVLRKICKCVKTHPEEAYGFLMGMLKPWKFGSGYCIAIHKCPYFHFHHYCENGEREWLPERRRGFRGRRFQRPRWGPANPLPERIPPHETYGESDVVENFPEIKGKPVYLEK